MFDHIGIRVADRAASERFYDTVLATLGIEGGKYGDFSHWGDDFFVSEGERPTQRLHVGFAAPSREAVDEFWRVGTAAGYASDGEPGPRPEYSHDYYGSFLLDPDGNSAEAVHHDNLLSAAADHVWIRVGDLAASRRFYETAGLSVTREVEGRVGFGHFSIVEGEPTANLHLAFPAASNDEVDRWHAAMLADGHTDNGAPGFRPQYHARYYGAFVLDPDGNNIELVCHNRGG